MWDGEFCGSIGFRWQPGTTALPPTCLGHIGYAVVPWKRGRGYATAALAQMLDEARSIGLDYVEITTTPDNAASQRMILNNGGRFVEEFQSHYSHGGDPTLRYRIPLSGTSLEG
jgi:predicted acetyltransferase